MSQKVSRYKDILAALIHRGYLPNEVPPAVTGKYFATYCKDNYQYLTGEKPRLLKTSTNYDTFTAPHGINGRRQLAIVHPVSQLAISLVITEHRTKIRKIIDRPEKMTLYSTDDAVVVGKAFEGLNFKKWRDLSTRLCAENEFVLKADISRFFYTAYTHSLPWAVLGKERVKQLLSGNRAQLERHWSHELDRALQCCQSKETFGFPVGPDTSRIVAEILMSGVEEDREFRRLERRAISLQHILRP